MLGNDADTGVDSGLFLHGGTNDRSLCRQKRYGLPLHVGAHQGAVRIVVLQERNERRSDGEDHAGRYVHVVEHGTGIFLGLIPETAGDGLPYEMPFLVQLLVRLGYMVIVFFIGGHVDNFVRDTGVVLVRLVDLPIRSLDEAVFIDPGESSQRVDQTDIRSFRGLNGAHSSVVGIMYISDLESGPVTGQTAGTKGGKTSLVGKLTQRIRLVHELGQLGGTEEFLHGCSHRLDINEGLGRDNLLVLGGHTLSDDTLHTGEADAVLVLQQLADRTDSTVAQMIDIVFVSDAPLKVHIVIDGSEDILSRNMLGNEVMDIGLEGLLQVLFLRVLLKNLLQDREIYHLLDAEFGLGVEVDISGEVYHHIGKNLLVPLLCLNPDIGNRRVLDLLCQSPVKVGAGGSNDFTGLLVNDILSQGMAGDAVSEGKFLIEFVTADLRQVIAAGVEKHTCNQGLCALDSQRLAGTDLLVEFKEALLVGSVGICLRDCRVLLEGSQNLRLFTEGIYDFLVRAKTQGPQEDGNRNLPGPVDTDGKYVVGIRLVLEPGTPVGDDGAGIELLPEFVVVNAIVDAGGTDELGYDDTLGAVDDEGTCIRHQGKVAHEDLVLVDLVGFFIVKAYTYLEGSRIGGIPGLTLRDRVLDLIPGEGEIRELQREMAAVIGDRGNIIKGFLQTFIQKPLIGTLLNIDEVRHLQNFTLAGVAHPNSLSGFHRTYSVFLHVYTTFRNCFASKRTSPRRLVNSDFACARLR